MTIVLKIDYKLMIWILTYYILCSTNDRNIYSNRHFKVIIILADERRHKKKNY